jgi:hypothetical protein
MVWTSTGDVRLLTGLTTSDISDDDLNSLIAASQKEVLLQINTKIIREEVEFIDQTRQNEIDGTNTTYYIKNWEGKFISDYNYDLSVDTSDIILVAVDNNDSTESSVSISSVTYNEGKFVVTTIQDNVDLFVTYAYSYFDPVTPNPLLKLATEYLAGAYAYMRIDGSQKKQVKFGNVSITNSVGSDSSYFFFYNKYMDIIRQLNDNVGNGAIWGVSHVLI